MRHRPTGTSAGDSSRFLRLLVVGFVVVLGIYGAWQRQASVRDDASATADRADAASAKSGREPDRSDSDATIASPDSPPVRTRFDNQTIRDSEGNIVFRGEVDVGPTLERINRGQRLSFSHDGIVFQNREQRLPKKPGGYYHEFVHPTPRASGAGPQRIIVGRDGEMYYTPDHYRTFQRLENE